MHPKKTKKTQLHKVFNNFIYTKKNIILYIQKKKINFSKLYKVLKHF